MKTRILCFWIAITFFGCRPEMKEANNDVPSAYPERGALLTTRFTSLEQLRQQVDISYVKEGKPCVLLRHKVNDQVVTSQLCKAISERDLIRAQKGSLADKLEAGVKSPYTVMSRKEMLSGYYLARRKYEIFGEGDVAFFDLAQHMVKHIRKPYRDTMPKADLGEKGYLNTFNHVTAQAFYTAIFSERLADFIADLHERDRLPELITGEFSEEQLHDINEGPVDNYIDLINNEWGQELGKYLKKKYGISSSTRWSEELLTDFLNELQSYFAWTFDISFKPFSTGEDIVQRYAARIEVIMDEAATFQKRS